MAEKETVLVGIADFQFLTRKALASLIKDIPGYKLISETDNPYTLPQHIEIHHPQVLIIDLRENDPNLVEQILALNKRNDLEILIITNSNDAAMINSLLKRGIKGLITKNCSEQEIVNALRTVSIGNRFYCNTVLSMIMEPAEEKKILSDHSPLTDREQEVLELIAEGHATQVIADKLHISVHTVNSHRKNIVKKFNITSPVHLLAYAADAGLISLNYDNK